MTLNHWVRLFEPFTSRTGSEIAVTVVCRLLASALILAVTVFVLRAATPFVISDAWFFVSTLIRPWQEGHLALADFFVKRGSSDHMNPLYRLILLMHTAWFQMDFTVEGLIGVCFAIASVYLWYRLSRQALAERFQTVVLAELIGLGLTSIVFSLSASGVYDWPLVTLAFMGIFAVSVMFAAIPGLLRAHRLGALALVVLAVFLVDDTYGVLAVASAVMLLSLLRIRGLLEPADWWRGVLALLVTAVAYTVTCHALVPYYGAGQTSEPLWRPIVSLFAAHWRESWKLIAVPAWSVIVTPGQGIRIFKMAHWLAVLVSVIAACVVCAGHVWFWRNWLRRETNTLSFVAAGLMLFFYFTMGAFAMARLPRFGFDYLSQPRYTQIYELQLVAMMMMSARVLADESSGRLHERLQVIVTVVLVGLAACYTTVAFHQIRFIQAFQVKLATQIEQLASAPETPPKDCLADYVTPCSHWSLAGRVAVLDTLERGPYNVFSPVFRKRHRHQVPASWRVPPLPR